MFEEYPTVYRSMCKIEKVLNSYHNVTVSVSGGSDSDIMIALLNELKHDIVPKINYVYFDTGLEYAATKEHINYLSERYNINIDTFKAHTPIPIAVNTHGLPFISKRISGYIARLQKHNFTWSTDNFKNLYTRFPKCKAALRWFCNEFGENSRFNIQYTKGLREFLINNPPDFKISEQCCNCAKKKTAHLAYKQYDSELSIQGLRKYEGGARNVINNCWDKDNKTFYPLLWYKEEDKNIVEKYLKVQHSECYTKYGLKRTGCAGCPFGQQYEKELEIIKQYEPKLYKACINIFGKSYDYTKLFMKER